MSVIVRMLVGLVVSLVMGILWARWATWYWDCREREYRERVDAIECLRRERDGEDAR